ncbi:MAG: ATP-binding cassette domain-containing protein [Deltaproteobacteria bacterium]|nr:MAG: ATP-binding cassette domain-containing protein [Deltaproteobacteria bacterium]
MSAIEIRGLHIGGDPRPRLRGIDLELRSGEMVVLIGPNGAGKSTLIQAITGAAGTDSGDLRIGGTPQDRLDRGQRAAHIAWLPQQTRLEEGLTGIEVVAAARFRHREPWRVALEAAREHLRRLGAEAWAHRRMTTLSGGEAQRVRLASLSAQEADWWLLDEPGNHLDPAVRLRVYEAVCTRAQQGGGVVIVTHDIGALAHLPQARVIGLSEGEVRFDLRAPDPQLPAALGALLGLELATSDGALVVRGPRGEPPPSEASASEEGARPSSTLQGMAAVIGLSLVGVLVAPWIGLSLDAETGPFVLLELRLPRALLGAVIGGTLALTGAAFQAVLENPLATPSTIGTTAGASLGALAVLVLLPAAAVGSTTVALGAFAGALFVSLAIASLATLRRFRTEELLLAGIAISLGAGAAITGLQLQADASATLASVRWSLGSLSIVGYERLIAVLPFAGLGSIAVLAQTGSLHSMVAGSERARTQGVDVVRTRTLVLGAGSLAVAGCVAVAGPIAFIGLVVPHLVRLFVGGGPRRLLWLSLIAGAGFLPLADGLARVAWPGRELPVGVLTAALGAPTLLALLWRRRPR